MFSVKFQSGFPRYFVWMRMIGLTYFDISGIYETLWKKILSAYSQPLQTHIV